MAFKRDITNKNIKRHDLQSKPTKIVKKRDLYKFSNARDCDHFTWEQRYFDLTIKQENIETVKLYHVPFGFKGLMSHIMIWFEYWYGKEIVLSVEARRLVWESFEAKKWLLKRYWLLYIWWTKNDLIWLRRDIRKQKVYEYKLNFDKEQIWKWFNFYVEKTNETNENSIYYNTIYRNCTTALWEVFNLMGKNKKPKYNLKVLFSWHIDKYLYELWYISNSKPFTIVKQQALLKAKL